MNAKNICLLGFSKQSEKTIRDQLETRCVDYRLEWVSANAKSLDGVIINAMFLDTPQISKYVSAVSAPCVAIYTNTAGRNIAAEQGISAIELSEPLRFSDDWLAALLQGKKSASTKTTSSSSLGSNAAKSGSNDYRELIKIVTEQRPVYVTATCGSKTVHLEPAKHHAYIDFAREDIPGIEKWQWYTTDKRPNTDGLRRINIEQWIFETIWQSQAIAFNVDSSMLYKLIRWPQPFSKAKRSEALRLAAQIKFNPVSVSELIEKTHFPSKLIEQFLFATNQAGQVEVIPSSSFTPSQANEPQRRQDPDREVKKSFIGRLRSKLGL